MLTWPLRLTFGCHTSESKSVSCGATDASARRRRSRPLLAIEVAAICPRLIRLSLTRQWLGQLELFLELQPDFFQRF